MFFLSKALLFLLNPLVWVIVLAVYGLFLRKSWIVYVSILLLYFFSISYPIDRIMETWEFSPRALPAIFEARERNANSPPRVAIVLAGMLPVQIGNASKPIDMGGSAERLLVALRLYQTEKVDRLIITGGSGLVFNQSFRESAILKKIATDLGIPSAHIIIETDSRNTYENARNTTSIIKTKYAKSPLLLITSAFHMERAYQAFRKQEIYPDVYPVDFRSAKHIMGNTNNANATTEEKSIDSNSSVNLQKISKIVAELEPNTIALQNWQIFLKEVFGIITYNVLGYI